MNSVAADFLTLRIRRTVVQGGEEQSPKKLATGVESMESVRVLKA